MESLPGSQSSLDLPSGDSTAAADDQVVLSPPSAICTIHLHSLGDAILFTLAVAVPTMTWAEAWRGRPMIDQKGDLWVIPTVIVIVAYFVGGAIAGRHRRRPSGAVAQGVALAVTTSVIMVVADLVRRVVVGKPQSAAVAGLWLVAIGGTVVIAATGAMAGRWLYTQRLEHSGRIGSRRRNLG